MIEIILTPCFRNLNSYIKIDELVLSYLLQPIWTFLLVEGSATHDTADPTADAAADPTADAADGPTADAADGPSAYTAADWTTPATIIVVVPSIVIVPSVIVVPSVVVQSVVVVPTVVVPSVIVVPTVVIAPSAKRLLQNKINISIFPPD